MKLSEKIRSRVDGFLEGDPADVVLRGWADQASQLEAENAVLRMRQVRLEAVAEAARPLVKATQTHFAYSGYLKAPNIGKTIGSVLQALAALEDDRADTE